MRPEPLLQALETKQGEIARQAMERHADGDAFAYGRACGIYAGLELAKVLLLDTLRDENERDL